MLTKRMMSRVYGIAMALVLAVAAVMAAPVTAYAATGDGDAPPSGYGVEDPYTTVDGWILSDFDPVSFLYLTQIRPDGSLIRLEVDENGMVIDVNELGFVDRSGKPSGPKQQVVQVVSSIQSFAVGSAKDVTFTFPKRNVQSKFTELDSLRVTTMKDPATGDIFWIGPEHYTVDGKKITVNASVFAQLTPGAHKVQFLFSDGAYAEATITVFDQSNFDAKYYADKNADIKEKLGEDAQALWNHYVTNGQNETRNVRIAK